MEITFDSPVDAVIVPEMKKNLSSVIIRNIVDYYTEKRVVAFTAEIGAVTLWEGDTYDAIGQWTDTDVINRIKEIYST